MMITYHTRPCLHCGKQSKLELEFSKFVEWQAKGRFVQNVWPEMSPDERELLVSGTHPKCWKAMFGYEE